jgi:hypothetical protein
VTTYPDGSEKGIDIYAHSVADGLWYWYPSTDTYLIDLTTGTVRFGGKKFTYKLTDTTLTLTIDGQQYQASGRTFTAHRSVERDGDATEVSKSGTYTVVRAFILASLKIPHSRLSMGNF